jgi:hypothetical protein
MLLMDFKFNRRKPPSVTVDFPISSFKATFNQIDGFKPLSSDFTNKCFVNSFVNKKSLAIFPSSHIFTVFTVIKKGFIKVFFDISGVLGVTKKGRVRHFGIFGSL